MNSYEQDPVGEQTYGRLPFSEKSKRSLNFDPIDGLQQKVLGNGTMEKMTLTDADGENLEWYK